MKDPKDQKFIQKMKEGIEKALDRYKDIPDFSTFKEKIDKVLLWIDTYGYAPASSLFFIGRK